MGKVDDDTVSNGQLKRDNQCLGEGEGEGFPNKKHDKEVSTDDVRSEVSNPPLTLTSPKQASQDITSQTQPQPQPQPHPQPQPECGEVTSACHSHSHSDSDQSDRGVVTSRFVVEIPEYAATSGIRKITFKFSKPKDHSQPHSYDHSSLSPMLDAFLDFPGAASPPPPHSDFKRSNKVPTNVKKLLSTGILDGARVKYVYGSSKLDGIISGGGYLCSCSSCNFSRVLSAYEFEQHAGAKTRHPNNHIYLDNGRPIYSIIQQLKTAPLGILDQLINDLLGSSVNHHYLRLWKETLHENDRLAQVAKRHHKNLPRLSHPVVSCSIPAFEESVTSASYPLGQSNFWQQTFMETTGEPKRIMTKSSSFVSNSAVQHKKTPEGGGTKRRDNDLHRLLFMPNGLPDGAELAYFVKGQRMLGGYKQGNGIVCNCCNEEVSPSQFESHAGMAARRQPYRHIYTTNGLTLHDIAISLANGQNLTTGDSDDMCAVCGDGGDLVLCHGCPRAFHAACLDLPCVPQQEWHCPNCKDRSDHARKTAAGELLSPSRPFVIRLTRVVKAPEMEIGGCVVCRGHDFSAAKFDERTVMLCDQCEREFHVGCLRESGLCDLKELPKDKWFCCDDCSRIHLALQNSVSVGAEIIPDSLSNMIFKKHADKGLYLKGEAADLQWRILSGKSRRSEHLPFLSRSAAIFRECFDPIVAKSGRDLIPVMVYGRNISGQEFGGMYCVVLIVRSVVVSAGLLRVFGREVAELPLVATSREYQGKGYFQALFWCIERLLASLNVENIVLPAAEEAESIWTNKFGFTKMSEERVAKYMREVQFTIFKGTSMLEKAVQHSR